MHHITQHNSLNLALYASIDSLISVHVVVTFVHVRDLELAR